MTILKFQIFYNGQEHYDNKLVTYNDETNEWKIEKTEFNTGVFGNFWPHKKSRVNQKNLYIKYSINQKEYVFTSSEVAFQASKCQNAEDIIQFTDKNLHSGDSFRKGRRVLLRNDWEDVKTNVMIDILTCKFTQFDDLREILLSTEDSYMIEHTPIKGRDKFWADDNDGTGQNNLGLCLMTVRKNIGGKSPNKKCKTLLPNLYEFLKTNL